MITLRAFLRGANIIWTFASILVVLLMLIVICDTSFNVLPSMKNFNRNQGETRQTKWYKEIVLEGGKGGRVKFTFHTFNFWTPLNFFIFASRRQKLVLTMVQLVYCYRQWSLQFLTFFHSNRLKCHESESSIFLERLLRYGSYF